MATVTAGVDVATLQRLRPDLENPLLCVLDRRLLLALLQFDPLFPHTPVRMSIKSHFGLHFCISFCFFQLRALHGVSRKARLANMRSGGAAEGIDSGALSILITFHGNCESKCMKFCCFCRRDLAQSEIRVTRALQPNKSSGFVDQIHFSVFSIQFSVFSIYHQSLIFNLRLKSPPEDYCLYSYHIPLKRFKKLRNVTCCVLDS